MAMNHLDRQGFNLVELMVVLAILGLILVGVFGVVTTQNQAYHREETIIELQMNGRVAINIITRYVRMGGFGCNGNIDPGSANTSVNGFGAVVNATNGSESDPTNPAPDSLTVVTAARKIGVVDNNNGTADEEFEATASIPVILDDTSEKLNDYFNDSSKRYVYLSPCDNSDFLRIKDPVADDDTSFTISDKIRVDEGAEVYTVKAYSFSLKLPNEYSPPKPPGSNLVLDENTGDGRQEIAENIENLQFQYGWDRNGDNRFDPTDSNEWGNDPAASSNEKDIKAVKIFLLARSAHPDKEYKHSTTTYTINEASGDGAAVTIGPFSDGYHRSLLRATVMIRNLNF